MDSSQIANGIGESTYFDLQQYAADGDSMSRLDAIYKPLP